MANNEIEHTQPHEEAVRRLVEDTLTGEEKAQAEANLLACTDCLEEYLWYRAWWETMASPDYLQPLETRLKEKSPEKYQAYKKLMGRLAEPAAAAPAYDSATSLGFWSSLTVWRRLALAATFLWALVLSAGLYVLRQKDGGYRKLLAEDQKKSRSIGAAEQQVESLQKKVEELAALRNEQSGRIFELTQQLGAYEAPRVNDVDWRYLQMYPIRSGEDVALISRPKDKRSLGFIVRPPGEDSSHAYRLVILDSQKSEVIKLEDIKNDADGNIQVQMGKDFLKPGEYVLQIFDQGAGATRLVGQTRFRIQER